MDSILTTIKKAIGIEQDYTHFDPDIILHINSVIMALTQIGVGPSQGFFISDATATWADFLADRKDIEAVKTYIAMRVRLLFDPPTTSFVIEAMERQIKEFEWRLNVQVDKPVVSTTEGGGIIDEDQ